LPHSNPKQIHPKPANQGNAKAQLFRDSQEINDQHFLYQHQEGDTLLSKARTEAWPPQRLVPILNLQKRVLNRQIGL
jgi:hypothetical protein